MRREVGWGEEAVAELEVINDHFESQVRGRGTKFVEALDSVISSLLIFPFQGSPTKTTLAIVIRRISVRPFKVLVYYTVYPSVDLQTGEALDVIHFLACRHERQGDPNWVSRDPFRLP